MVVVVERDDPPGEKFREGKGMGRLIRTRQEEHRASDNSNRTRMRISVITPAHNEAAHLEKCLRSVRRAAEAAAVTHEHIVVLNRCTDETAFVAARGGGRIVHDDTRNLSHIRNCGAAVARGEILVTLDADSRVTPNMFSEVLRRLAAGRYIGGGVRIYPERWSPGIVCSLLVVAPFLLRHGVSAGMFWCQRRDFEAIGGFDTRLVCLEDFDFARRLKAFGRRQGKRYGTIRKARLVTSCRKFDPFGDWYFIKHPKMVFDIFKRRQKAADAFYYDARD
jgi:glycosyltransferase involved in cell wall biosynthesis